MLFRVSLVIAMIAAPAISQTQRTIATWLDEAKVASWNKPGASIPAAPKVQGTVDPKCKEQSRPPQLDEDKRVRDQGWDLIGAYQSGWQMLVIRGTATYDGNVPATPVSGLRVRARCLCRHTVAAADGQPR
jgi:hypothetical protein